MLGVRGFRFRMYGLGFKDFRGLGGLGSGCRV